MTNQPINASMTLRQIADEIYVNDLRPKTRERVRVELRRWEKLTEDPPLNRITKQTLREFRDHLIGEQYAPDTIIVNLGTIQTILRMACHEHDLIDSAPEIGRLRISRRQPDPRGATVEQVDALFNAAESMSWPRVHVEPVTLWRAWIALTAWTGLRISDSLLHLRSEHVLPDERCIVFQAAKTSKRHVFPLPDWLWRLIRPLCREPSDRLFPIALNSAHDDRLFRIPNLFRDRLKQLSEQAGVDNVLPKNLRQFAVTQWTIANSRAGELVHGCGLPRVLKHYIGVLRILEAAEPDVVMPASFTGGSCAAPPATSPDEWRFREGQVFCRGQWYTLRSRPKLAILQHLVESDGPVSWRLLCGHLNGWPSPDDDENGLVYKRVVIAICEIRKLLREALNLPGGFDPIPCTQRGFGAAWTVYLPPTVGLRREDAA